MRIFQPGCQMFKGEHKINRLARDSAEALVRMPLARRVIPVIAKALLERGSLNGTEILELSREAKIFKFLPPTKALRPHQRL
jgi:hypothetical protein